jgi:phospholipid/cholesterol/gamma-HCH transport system ATP-binding protein
MNHEKDEAVRFEKVSKSFDPEPLLENVSFKVAHGEAFCILGRSGTGKTVLLKLMVGMLKPDRGRIFINQEEITALDRPGILRVRKNVGFLFQNAALFDSISVAENLAFPMRRHSGKTENQIREAVHQKLAQVDLESYADKLPADLSAGLRKRVGLARALALDPAILLIDDPSCGVDCFTAHKVDRLLLDLKRNRKITLIIVSDGMEGVRRISDRFAVLESGHIISCGSADELERSDNRLVRQFVSREDF